MKRLNLIGSWKRIGLQAGLLGGLGLAFVGGSEQPVQAEEDTCPLEGECTFLKPNFMIIMDYSTSMNNDFGGGQTRWEAAEDAVTNLATTKFNNENMHLALMRFGHDPSGQSGTTIMGDSSNPPITDGQALDVSWYDVDGNDKGFYPCNGDALVTALETNIPAPIDGMLTGIGTWTKGSLDFASGVIAQSKTDHPMDGDDRFYANMVLTDGVWTDQGGTMSLKPNSENPALTAANLYDNQAIPTYVVFFGDKNDNAASMAAAELATAGGTTSINAENAMELEDALKAIIQQIKDDVVQPQCAPGLPRFMVLLDASSSMLNVNGGKNFGAEGETGWDKARDALAGMDSIFDIPVNGGQSAEDLIHLGLAVFGHNQPAPGEQKILVDYGPCHKDNFEWALDPNTSCGNGCNDPWGGPAITWTFLDGQVEDPPGFNDQTLSHMPKCLGNMGFCSGSGTYTHLGLQLIKQNKADYHAFASDPNNNPPYPTNDATVFTNILITDGQYSGYSTDAQVKGELESMYGDGITTYVIGFGDGVDSPQAIAQLKKMAGWGSANNFEYFKAADQMALEEAFKDIIEAQEFDPCCSFNDCSANPELDDENQCDPNDAGSCNESQTCELDDNNEWYVCKDANCGNGNMDEGEECDDGNTMDGDGCSSKCILEGCGDGVVDEGEECDDGNSIDNDECTNACGLPKCGDGVIQGSEECDDGNSDPDDLCSNDCMSQEPGTTSGGTDTGTTTGGTTSGETETGGTGTGTGTTGGSSTSAGSTSAGTSDSATAGDTDTDTGMEPGIDDEGCGGCSVEDSVEGKTRGLLGVLFGLGFAGMIRRRRRS